MCSRGIYSADAMQTWFSLFSLPMYVNSLDDAHRTCVLRGFHTAASVSSSTVPLIFKRVFIFYTCCTRYNTVSVHFKQGSCRRKFLMWIHRCTGTHHRWTARFMDCEHADCCMNEALPIKNLYQRPLSIPTYAIRVTWPTIACAWNVRASMEDE